MSVILGINAFHPGASAAVLVDGTPVAAIAEERLNRTKYYANFPRLAIHKCLEMAGLTFRDIDYVAVGRDPLSNRMKKIEYVLRNPSKLLNLAKIKAARSGLDDIKNLFSRECNVAPRDLRFEQINIEHHLAHIASAYFISPWDRCAGFSMDGSGDFVSCMIAECKGKEIHIKNRIYVPHSLGSFYTMICEFIGYRKYGDEGKVMGMAALGESTYQEYFQDMIQLSQDRFELNPKYFRPFGSAQGMSINEKGEMVINRHYSDFMIELFGEPREPYAEISKRDLDLAFGLQQQFEKIYMHMLNRAYQMVPEERVAMAGGSVLNSVANGKLFEATPFRKTTIQPAAGDEGLALGAALYFSQTVLRDKERYVMNDAFLGPEYSEYEIRAALEKGNVHYERLSREKLINTTADEIEKGSVVGWFQGRMEWGPRALGNRSILANPCLDNMKDILNSRVKHREWFRPFAPSVLLENQSEIFEHTHPSPFMLHVYKIKPEWREKLVAVNHVDDTGRLQSVAREENPLYYDLIKRFGQKTGVPVILNTSFNENEPIVCNPGEAVDCYLRTKMDVLVIGPFVCSKPE